MKRINSAWFPVHVVSKIGKFLQTESNIEVKGTGGRRK